MSKPVNEYKDVRPMTLHERFSLMRQNTGDPHIILHVITYPVAQLPSREQLKTRVDELQAALPMLHPRVQDALTTHPAYIPGEPWPASSIVRDITFTPQADATAESLDIYRRCMKDAEVLRSDKETMWQLTLARPEGAGERAYLAIAINHLLVDGMGSASLVRVITEDLGKKSSVEPEAWDKPTRFDDTISTAPTLGFLLPVVFRELMLPKMPVFVQKPFTKSDPWPATAVKPGPLGADWDIQLVSIPAEKLPKLKAEGKAHDIPTLHPLFKIAYTAAMWRVFGDTSGSNIPLRLIMSTARGERDPALGHAAITHNYVSSVEWDVQIAGSDSFWSRARDANHNVSSEEGLKEGRMTMGLLKHIPDPEPNPNAKDFDPTRPTGWEKYFVERASSAAPFRHSSALSNLGLMKLPPGATDMFWGQSATPFGGAVMANFVGHEGGVRVTTAYRIAATDNERTREVHRVFLAVLDRVIAGDADKTIAEVTA